MKLLALPAFDDNYIWLLHNGAHAWVVDPGDADVVQRALHTHRLHLQGILVTHHHGDHTGGVVALQNQTKATTWLPPTECADLNGQRAQPGARIDVLGSAFEVMAVPGHTAGHIAYFAPHVPLDAGAAPLLFCGDTLFSAGCGRLFEGTPAQMWASLQALAALPGDTLVCAAHEYTLSNLRFAAAVEPDNADVQQHFDWAVQQRAKQQPTLPTTIALERRINPFLRPHLPSVRRSLTDVPARADDTTVWAALRAWKNDFK